MGTLKVTSNLREMLSRGDFAAVYSGLMGERREGRARFSWEVKGDSERDKVEHRKYQLDDRENEYPGWVVRRFLKIFCSIQVYHNGTSRWFILHHAAQVELRLSIKPVLVCRTWGQRRLGTHWAKKRGLFSNA